MRFCIGHPCIQWATSLAIFTTTLPPQPSFALSWMITLRQSLCPWPIPMYFPSLSLTRFMSSKAWIYHRSMTLHMFHGRSIPLAVQPLIIPAFLLLPRIQLPLRQYKTAMTPQHRCPLQPQELWHPPLLPQKQPVLFTFRAPHFFG